MIHVDVRVLAATNKDLAKEVAAGAFREDLFFRLDVFPIRVPALRERQDDIPLLADAFVAAFCKENGLKTKAIDRWSTKRWPDASWPGNVRELKNVVERAAILSGDVITIADLPEDPHASPFDDDDDGPPSVAPRSLGRHCTSDRKDSGERLTLREYREASERGVHRRDAEVLRLEHLQGGGRAGRGAHEPAQEDPRLWHQARRRLTEAPSPARVIPDRSA